MRRTSIVKQFLSEFLFLSVVLLLFVYVSFIVAPFSASPHKILFLNFKTLVRFFLTAMATFGYGYERSRNTSLTAQVESLKAENLNLTQMNGKLNVDYLNLSRNYTDLELKYKILESSRTWDFIPVSYDSLLKLCIIAGVGYLACYGGLSLYKYWNSCSNNEYTEVLKRLAKLHSELNDTIKTVPSADYLNTVLGEMYLVDQVNKANIHILVELGRGSNALLKSLYRNSVQFRLDTFTPTPTNTTEILELVEHFREISDLAITSGLI